MVRKHTPWISTIRVFKLHPVEVNEMLNIHGARFLKCTCEDLDTAAASANNIIHNLIKENRNGKA